jgi:hypothetical protein
MKKLVILFAVLSLAVFILLPANSNGKYNVSKPLVADGSPLPWPPFPPSAGTLVADGSPLPWPPFPPGGGTLVADGSPLPWPPFPPGAGTTLA